MTPIIHSLAQVAPRYGALFCDLWGCLHNGVRAFPAAVAALQAFRAGGGKVVLVTNAPRPKSSVVRQLERLGVPRDAWDEVATSGDAAQHALLSGAVGYRIHHIGPIEKDRAFFSDFADDLAPLAAKAPPFEFVPLSQADGIVCTGPNDEEKDVPEDYRPQFLLAKTMGLKLLCANPDLVVDYGDRRIYCAGALAELYDRMGGRSLYFGKPHPPIYDLARRRLATLDAAIGDGDILCVGDGIATDIAGGAAEGLDTLFVTGGLMADAFGPDSANPDKDLLGEWVAGQDHRPTLAIGQLR
ncbi:MAG TPA: TIGR01459 family HAD-type hydrolase [Paracoccaceae bacterium]|nr:TIGR01459 family HAD-type hydrolase [Paracoccaceae bacterium]HMO72805.1 TIGR01459 family HAD-type hydrolase [Paracoccaceae bacterium]